jgi:integrase
MTLWKPAPEPTSRPFVRQRASGPFWYAKWSRDGTPVVRALGRAWVERDSEGGWRPRRGRARDGALTEAQAGARMFEIVRAHHLNESRVEQDEGERRRRGLTFRELGHEWLHFLQHEKGARPSTLSDYRQMLAEPGVPHRRGAGKTPGPLIEHFGNRRAQEITTRQVADYLRALERTGASPRKVNRHRQVISAMYGYAMREDSHSFEHNPARGTSRRREPPPAVLDVYEPEEVEALARAAEGGEHRNVSKLRYDAAEMAARDGENRQDAELYRIAAYTGLRLGELRALRWGDVNLVDRRLVVQRAFSHGIERPSKSWQARFIPIADQAAEAFARLSTRRDFVGGDDYVFCSRLGGPLDGSALRRRYQAAAAAAGLRALHFHALRHGAGSMIAREADPRWVQGFLGHSSITTTERYLHTKARPDDVERLNRAFAPGPASLADPSPAS